MIRPQAFASSAGYAPGIEPLHVEIFPTATIVLLEEL
jgi:hypothetical protein